MIDRKSGFIGVIEDDQDISNLVKRYLEREGFEVRTEGGTRDWKKVGLDSGLKLLVLDWMLPDQSGLDILKTIRSEKNLTTTPVLMLTARVDDTDVVRALEAGADDYVPKPFSASVLVARVQALLRRAESHKSRNLESDAGGSIKQNLKSNLSLGHLTLDLEAHRALLKGQELMMTPSEFKLLEALIGSIGKVLTRNALIEALKGPGITVVERTIDNHVLSLRKKLGPETGSLIETVRGIGYRVSFPETSVQNKNEN
jgi:two-component system alkaline phosphatase synthesis response regulator PhoP